MNTYKNLDFENIPEHIAIIMDGNGRWAKEKGKKRFLGHIEGVKAVQRIVQTSIKLNVKYLTLFAFSNTCMVWSIKTLLGNALSELNMLHIPILGPETISGGS